MEGVAHVDAVPQVLLGCVVGDVARVGRDTDGVEDVHQGRSDPLGDVRPALLARDLGDLAAHGKTLEVRERKRCGVGDKAVDLQPPVGEAVGLQALEEIVRRRGGVREGCFGDHAARELAGEGMLCEEALCGVGEGFAGTVEAAVVGRDKTVALCHAIGGSEAREACGGGNAGGDEFAAGDGFHTRSWVAIAGGAMAGEAIVGDARALPVIMARVRVLNPAIHTIATWTTKKSTRALVMKKCSVRADCLPPSTLTAKGVAESNDGDRASPVQMTSGNRTKMTPR
jgi:hypothetical protein